MQMTRGLLISGLLAMVALAGCVGSEETTGGDAARPAAVGEISDEFARLVGVITDDEFTPIIGAQIGVLGLDGEFSTTSDENGGFMIDQLPPGRATVAVQKLGYDSSAQSITLVAGEQADVAFIISAVEVSMEGRHLTLIGNGYFACGAYLVVTSWGNLDACVWDNHQPRYNFEFSTPGSMGLLQEVEWQQNTFLTAEQLQIYLDYKPVCDPFCSSEERFGSKTGESPLRQYIDMEGDLEDLAEDPVPLSSMTFPAGDSTPVIVFQQRMTHYITLFWNQHGDEEFSALPDA